jgi:PAS domain S-box-containing protein
LALSDVVPFSSPREETPSATPSAETPDAHVAARRRAERALAENERTLKAIVDHAFQFIGLLDPSGRLLRPNQPALDAVGARREDVVGRYFWDTPWWTHSRAEQDRLRDAVGRAARGEFVRFETTHPDRSGNLICIDFSLTPVKDDAGTVTALIPEGRDITEHKRAQQSLRESEEKFAKAFRASPYSLTLSEVATGRYLEVNAGFERVSGYTRDEVIGRTSVELGLWSDPADRERMVARLQADGAVRGLEVTFLNRHGRKVIARCSGEMLEVGGRPCLLNTIEDVTEQRRAEEVRAALEAQLRQTQKLEALGQLAGGIAHDFNNILTGIFAYSELAALDAGQPGDVRRHVEEIRKAANRAKDLVRQILAFSRQQVQERVPVRLHPVVREAVEFLRSSLPKTLEIDARIDPRAPVVLADTTQIHQVVMNLCTNAAHAMRHRPGCLTVVLEGVQLDAGGCAASPGLQPGRYARLVVTDTGHGMSPEVLKRVFEPFYTTKEQGEGTGLGLAVVHGVAESHDGAVAVRSRENEGTTFEVYFPEYVGLSLPAVPDTSGVPRGRGERVLVVDDERMIADAVRGLLEHLGYRVTARCDPIQALELFRGDPDAFDLVVTDFTMPRLTGVELAREVIALRPEVPVLLLSGHSGTWTLEKLRALGVRGLLNKPMSAGDLASAARRALEAGAA